MQLLRKVIKGFGKTEGPVIAEEQYLALKAGDRIFVELDREEPDVREIIAFGLRSPLIATARSGYNYNYFFVEGSHPTNPKTQNYLYSVHKTRFRGLAPTQ